MNVMSGHGQARWRHHLSSVGFALAPCLLHAPPRFPQPTLIWAERELDLQGRLVPPLCSQTSARRRYGDRAEQWSCRPVALFTEDVREGGKDGESFIMLNEMYE